MLKNPKRTTDPGSREAAACGGFTFVELVVAMAIGAAVIMVAVMAYGAISGAGPTRRQDTVRLTASAVNYYNTTNNYIAVSEAPNFGAAAAAESMRQRLLSDMASSSAVCCLARNVANTPALRTNTIMVTNGLDLRSLVTPEDFRTQLIDPTGAVYTNFSGASTATNLSIYLLSYSGTTNSVLVKAIYETDFQTVTNDPPGVYATVRRYQGTTMTDYYHIFYPGQTNNFSPLAAFFVKSSLGTSGANAVDRYRQAEKRPFYFVWWPDPSRGNLASDYEAEAQTNAASPRFNTSGMAGATSLFFVLPAFPPL